MEKFTYFSLSSLFRNKLGVNLTPVECQALSYSLKYATTRLKLSSVKKRRDKTLGGNRSPQYDTVLEHFAQSLYNKYKGRSYVSQEFALKVSEEAFKNHFSP